MGERLLDVAEVSFEHSVVVVEPRRLVIDGERTVVFALRGDEVLVVIHVDLAQQVMAFDEIGVERDGAFGGGPRLGHTIGRRDELADHARGNTFAERRPGLRIFGIFLDGRFELRARHAAGFDVAPRAQAQPLEVQLLRAHRGHMPR
jgi:hypothetical protein